MDRNARRRELYANRSDNERQQESLRRRTLLESRRNEINEHRRDIRDNNKRSSNELQKQYRILNSNVLNGQRRENHNVNRVVLNEQRRENLNLNRDVFNTSRREQYSANKRQKLSQTQYVGLTKYFDENEMTEFYVGPMNKETLNYAELYQLWKAQQQNVKA
ncbi:unnamed protein product [Allacma fusca]|uniref:Uncharacterized protein n=1 Tax=Allacma fusca TaxID=39272 RepID=A0A8J2P5G4_9HEXA|nr:unnamed protein product [Allacma fusca]